MATFTVKTSRHHFIPRLMLLVASHIASFGAIRLPVSTSRRMPTYSRREQLSSLAAFGLAAAVAPASAYDIVPAAEIERQLAALRAEADAASSGSPDGSYERPATDTPSAGKSSTGASSPACKSEEAGTPPALQQAAQLAVAGTVGIAQRRGDDEIGHFRTDGAFA